MPRNRDDGHSRLKAARDAENRNVRLFFCGLAALLCLDLLPGPYAVHYLFDIMQTEGAQCLYTGKMLLQTGVFGWDPSRWGGVPAGIAFSNPFGFLGVMLAFLPMWAVFTLEKIVFLAMLGYGLFRLLRDYAQASASAAMVLTMSSVAWFSAGQTAVPEAFTFPLLFMWTKDLALGQGSYPARLGKCLGLVLLFSMTCVAFVVPYYIPLACMLVVLAPRHWQKKRQLLATALIWGGYLLMAAPLVWGFLDFMPSVNRVETPTDFNLGQASLAFAWQVLANFLSINALPIFYCLHNLKTDKRFQLLLGVIFAFSLVLAFLSTPFYDHFLGGTFLHKTHLYRAGMVMPLCTLIVSAYALSITKQINRYSLVPTALAIVLALRSHSEATGIINVCLLVAFHLCILIFVTRQLRPSPKVLLTLLGCFFFMVVNLRMSDQTASDAHDLYAKGFENHPSLAQLSAQTQGQPLRVASIDLDPSIAKSYGFETLDGKYELIHMPFNEYMREIALPQFKSRQAAEAHFANQMLLFVTPPLKPKEQALHSFNRGLERKAADFNTGLLLAANVQYLFSSKPITGIEDFATLQTVDEGRGLPIARGTALDAAYKLPIYTYRVNQPLGRAFFAPNVRVLPRPEEVLPAMASALPETIRHTAFFTQAEAAKAGLPPQLLSAAPIAGDSGVTLAQYGTDAVSFRVHARTAGVLVVSQNFDKGWSASINGQPAPLLRVDHAFQGVLVDRPGEYTVDLRYAAPVTRALYWAALAGILCVLAASFIPAAHEAISLTPPPAIPMHLPRVEPWKIATLLGASTTLWCLGFVKFIWFKRPPDGRPFWYVVIFAPLVALAVCAFFVHAYNKLQQRSGK